MINDVPGLWRVAGRLTDHYQALGQINRERQRAYTERYGAAIELVRGLTGDGPPPLPDYANIFHHGTDGDTAQNLWRADIEAVGGDDFGLGFYTHTRENWMKAKEWGINTAHKRGKSHWGVVTFPVPDDIWEEEITSQLIYQNRHDRPGNAPRHPENGRPMSWSEFVRYNKSHKDNLPEWREYQVISGPFWGRRISRSRLRQAVFTSTGTPVLNRPEVRDLRILTKGRLRVRRRR
jgi:hypothetical protein